MPEIKMFRVRHPKMKGTATITYDGDLLIIKTGRLTLKQEIFTQMLGGKKLNEFGFIVKELTDIRPAGNEQLSIFCRVYKDMTGNRYAAQAQHARMLAKYAVSDQLVKTFLMSTEYWAKPKEVPVFVKNYNEIYRATLPNQSARIWPNEFDDKLCKNLKPDERAAYIGHLKSLGWTNQYAPGAGRNVWIAPQSNSSNETKV